MATFWPVPDGYVCVPCICVFSYPLCLYSTLVNVSWFLMCSMNKFDLTWLDLNTAAQTFGQVALLFDATFLLFSCSCNCSCAAPITGMHRDGWGGRGLPLKGLFQVPSSFPGFTKGMSLKSLGWIRNWHHCGARGTGYTNKLDSTLPSS